MNQKKAKRCRQLLRKLGADPKSHAPLSGRGLSATLNGGATDKPVTGRIVYRSLKKWNHALR